MEKEKVLVLIGAKIRELRESNKTSLQELADKCDFEKSNLVRIEKGNSNFTIGTLVKIANALEVELKDLIP